MKKHILHLHRFPAFALAFTLALALAPTPSFAGYDGLTSFEGDAIREVYNDNIFQTFAHNPITDENAALLYAEESEFFPLKKEDEKVTPALAVLEELKAKLKYKYYDGDTGNTVEGEDDFNDTGYKYYHNLSRLEIIKQMALSYKVNPSALRLMRYDGAGGAVSEKGTSLYPGNTDASRDFNISDLGKLTSENTKWNYGDSKQHAGIQQILFYDRDNYRSLNDYEIKPIWFDDVMKDYREGKAYYKDDRDTLKIAAWFENKFLMPLRAEGYKLPKGETRTLTGTEELAATIMQNRRRSFLQENILEALDTAAYVQTRTDTLLTFLGRPNASPSATSSEQAGKVGLGADNNNLIKTLIGEDIDFKFINARRSLYGKFLQGPDTDINSALKTNFIARQTFSQLLSVYQQVQAARLKLLSVHSMYAYSSSVSEDKTGTGPIKAIYEAEKALKKAAEQKPTGATTNGQ